MLTLQSGRTSVTVGLATLAVFVLYLLVARTDRQPSLSPLPPVGQIRKRWIVITTIQGPTDAVRRFADVSGWQLLIIGDKKTPSTWHYPGVIFLGLEQQEALGYAILSKVPRNSYARKNIGYLYAIQHGAEEIYESDDDNLLLDAALNLTSFFHAQNTALMYSTSAPLVNPYAHFGQPSIWPRGFPLSAVGGANPRLYNIINERHILVRQAVALGDPDVDAIFRLTRKVDGQPLNVAFDASAPPVALPALSLAPWNSQTTYFAYDAFWGLLIPITTSFRVCDIWRSYWTQRLLWEVAGRLAFYPPAVYQDRNAHNYLRDFIEERALYEDAGRMVDFLRAWQPPKGARTIYEIMSALSRAFVAEKFWGQGDAELTDLWIRDLRAVGYLSPPLRHLAPPADTPTKWTPKRLCAPALSVSHSLYPRTLLVVILASEVEYDNVDFLRSVYVHAFRRMVFYGPRATDDVEACDLTISTPGDAAYRCVAAAVMLCSECEGFLIVRSDTALKWWMLAPLNFSAAWMPAGGDAVTLAPPAGVAEAVWDAGLGGRWADATTGCVMT